MTVSIIYGHSNAAGPLHDLWAFDLAARTWKALSSPPPQGAVPPAASASLAAAVLAAAAAAAGRPSAPPLELEPPVGSLGDRLMRAACAGGAAEVPAAPAGLSRHLAGWQYSAPRAAWERLAAPAGVAARGAHGASAGHAR